MIKDNDLVPAIRVMALIAVFTQFTLVNIIMGVTTAALCIKVIINIFTCMTGHTMYLFMTTKKWVVGIPVMAKMRFLPTRQLVAISTFATVTAFVSILSLMAGNTLRFQLLLIKLAIVTGRTTDLCMAPAQAVFGVLVMIKLYLLPGALTVTVSALRAKLTPVLVVDLVTTDTTAGNLHKTTIGMT